MSSLMRDLVLWSQTICALAYQATPDRPTYCIYTATLDNDSEFNYYPFWRMIYCPIYRQIHQQNGLYRNQAEAMNNDTAEYKLHDVMTSCHHLRPKTKGENKLEASIPRICL